MNFSYKKYKVKIIGCEGKPGIWYAKRIGEIFEVTMELYPVIKYRIDYLFCIYAEHCEVINEVKHKEVYKKEPEKTFRPDRIKVTREIFDNIRYLNTTIITKKRIAQKLGLGICTVYRVVNNKNRRGVPYFTDI